MRFLLIIIYLIPSIAFANEKIKLFFNSPLAFDKPSDRTESVAGKVLIDNINNAKHTIDFAIYGIRRQPDIITALQNARERGVKIRGVVDKNYDGSHTYISTAKLIEVFPNTKTDDVYKPKKEFFEKKKCIAPNGYELQPPEGYNGYPSCVKYRLSNSKYIMSVQISKNKFPSNPIMHNKFFIFDKQTIWTGSTNISNSGTGGYNANLAILIKDKSIAKLYNKEFNQMYKKELFHKAKKQISYRKDNVEIFFSPAKWKSYKRIYTLIRNARSHINLSIFFLTHKGLSRELIRAHKRGVKVRIILDATAAKNEYTKHEILRVFGIPIKIENWGGKMHMKTAVIDDEYLITGSMNWTSAGQYTNDENTMIIKSKKLSREVSGYFNTMWNSLDDKLLTTEAQPNPEGLTSPQSCFDGVDNDFDEIIDADESSCQNETRYIHKLPPFYIIEE